MDALDGARLWALLVLLLGAVVLVGYGAARARLRRRRRPESPVEPLPPSTRPADAPGGTPRLDGAPAADDPARPTVAIIVPRETTRHAIVFAHGWLGADRVGLPGLRREYFRGVGRHLRREGFDVHFLRVSPAAGVERRANELAEQIARLGAPVNIIAHSMGGLDARYAISLLGLDRHVASLTTVGTPHHGTPIADVVVQRLASVLRLRSALELAGVDLDGLYDLTTPRMSAFNRLTADVGSVEYRSIIGRVREGEGRVHALLAPSFAYLCRSVGENDGLVPAESQQWGRVGDEVDADHWAQIGWSGDFDARVFYDRIARDLARRGL